MSEYHEHYSDEELEAQYNLRALRPDYDEKVVPAWVERSEARRRGDCQLDLPYGTAEREKLDWFPAPDPAGKPTLIYFHGGYWQRGDKFVYSFLAESFNKHGISLVLPNYTLCPAGSITGIASQARAAVAWVYRNLASLGGDPDKIYVSGHSAGGHITGMLMGTDWSALGDGLPRDLIKGGMPISPLNDLVPLMPTSININVAMGREEAVRESPMNHPPVTDAPMLVVCGARETLEFHRQSDMYVDAFLTDARSIERYSVPNCDHFDELNALADDTNTFFRKAVHLIERGLAWAQSGVDHGFLDRLTDAFNRHDVEAVVAHFAEDATMYGPAGPNIYGSTIEGRQAIADALRKRFAAAPDIRWNDSKDWIIGNKGLSEWRVTSTAADGSKVEVLGCDLYEFADGKVVKKDTYYKQVVR